ncbi:hypothetical protein FDI02_gp045 [Citrobacter phage Mordin]|uniref:Uncharacterized protein n=1 Tax=Citrobacter phage Mordin TaxID=1701846 RepID=A0A0K2CMN5_9CAUD|nr:hypothetical protein FDI02_gp045 [Citrobacter phage Mordin]ALA06911.1 hypothetical protein Mordin_95 [Citrobacter phage Mordin]
MNKEIQVKVDTSCHGVQTQELMDATIYERGGELCLRFTEADNELRRVRDDEDGCPVFGWYGIDFPLYAYHYPDGQEDWTTQAILDELNGVPLEDEVTETTLLTFTFIKEEKVGDISVTEALQVTQVV